jgi:hypothetical protein
MNEEITEIARLTKRYATVKGMGAVAVLSEDVSGLTYVARWVRTSSIEEHPEGASWAEITGVNGEAR